MEMEKVRDRGGESKGWAEGGEGRKEGKWRTGIWGGDDVEWNRVWDGIGIATPKRESGLRSRKAHLQGPADGPAPGAARPCGRLFAGCSWCWTW